ncbi:MULTISPECIES: hypothetical protein [unclassified Acinetobacter]|uniref:hypothetical protein n=1 Tax=unclassified Acinetobacter TaxID=196816 RepID=UPI002448B057|nr:MULTISPECIES: hypothetical protein [unclassified Acinetobacter]MDH0032937.1 hypothetical protein [Acinetobacter sp. GD04021]MDH0887505.1 hypothetical protein [Acinetobacter sp. GD03873]MDH1084728.1 hypothetical protein [Acinetobacter sp. GD03983]MDH2190881.1 hypothetical protein [Acinetobacter sp. GD03645]MDH2205055.1 hypothetical protein [Acinetobacter sp. GD03647]
MKRTYLQLALASALTAMITPGYAGISFGDANSETGKLTVAGYIRGNYQLKHYGEDADDQKLRFDAAQLKLDYERDDLFGHVEYRCYQYERLCDFSTMIDAYVGYRLNQTDQLVVGMQPIPFGAGRFWGNSLYGSINTTAGLEDVHNVGVNYHAELPTATKFDVGYFAIDGGHYSGQYTPDSGRYTSNYVHSDDPTQTDLQEKNMWIARVSQDIALGIDGLGTQVGASYWRSDIDNKSTDQTGRREAWAVFGKVNYGNLGVTLTGGKNDVSNKDLVQPEASLMGSYDSEYQVANKASYYTVDAGYSFKNVGKIGHITPYVMHSRYDKDMDAAKDSIRNIIGVTIDHKQLSLVAEYIMGKNDPFIGGTASSLALGDDNKWNKLLNLTLFYYF